MKKELFVLVLGLFLIGFISASENNILLIKNNPSNEDIVKITSLVSIFSSKWGINPAILPLAEYYSDKLNSSLSVFICGDKTKIIVKESAPSSDLVLATNIAAYLHNSLGFSNAVILPSNEINLNDLKGTECRYDFEVSMQSKDSSSNVEGNKSNNNCTAQCYCGMKEIEYSICTLSDCSSVQTPCQNGCDNVIGKCRTQENREVTEKVTCNFQNSNEKHHCCFKQMSGGDNCCEQIGNCTLDAGGLRYSVLNWTSDCLGQAQTIMDGESKSVYFDCDSARCSQIGLRNKTEYCSAENKWVNQKKKEEVCDNNFECSSNVCVSGKCIDAGLLQRIMNWFKNLFG